MGRREIGAGADDDPTIVDVVRSRTLEAGDVERREYAVIQDIGVPDVPAKDGFGGITTDDGAAFVDTHRIRGPRLARNIDRREYPLIEEKPLSRRRSKNPDYLLLVVDFGSPRARIACTGHHHRSECRS